MLFWTRVKKYKILGTSVVGIAKGKYLVSEKLYRNNEDEHFEPLKPPGYFLAKSDGSVEIFGNRDQWLNKCKKIDHDFQENLKRPMVFRSEFAAGVIIWLAQLLLIWILFGLLISRIRRRRANLERNLEESKRGRSGPVENLAE
jgi:hypothetical protein